MPLNFEELECFYVKEINIFKQNETPVIMVCSYNSKKYGLSRKMA